MMHTIAESVIMLILFWGASAGAQGISVDEPDICLVCHAEIEALSEKSHVHTAFEAGICSDCHNPHASRHAALLNSASGPLCLECHEDMTLDGAPELSHRPVNEGNCTACHDPHASDYSGQLTQPMLALCVSCHPSTSQWLSSAHVHAPAAGEECLTCHTPHGGAESGLLKTAVPVICFDCHEQDNTFSQAHSGYRVENANCITCHDPHASSLASFLMPNQHAPFRSKKCDVCHTEGGGSAFSLTADVKTVCVQCHGSVKRTAQEPYAHNLNDDQSCLHCHNPHASSEAKLLSGPQTVTCTRCHFTDGEYASMPKERILTHDGMDCSTCHEPHGSANDLYLVDDNMNLCGGCHEGAHRTSHPVGPDVIDPRSGKPVTCLSCHKLHGAAFDQYLPFSQEMDLCIQCHRK